MPSLYNTAKREVVDVGVDWITCSTSSQNQYKKQTVTAERLIAKERDRGNRPTRVTVEGYAGYQCGQVFAGALGGRMLVRLSGALAADEWREAYAAAANVSRLDLQATIRYSPEVPYVATRVERDVLKKIGTSKVPLDVGIMRSRVKGATCVIGRRVSDRYARVYDKHRESKLEDFRGCWRWEVELKRAVATQAAAKLIRTEAEAPAISGYLSHTFQGYGVSRLWATPGRLYSSIRQPSRPEAVAVLSWLTSQVSGRVGWLLERGYTQEVIEALGLSGVVTINQDQATKE